jgi:hypothetical protein
MKKFLPIMLVLIAITGNAQKKKKKAIKCFDLGVIAFNKKDFKTADSLFTLSAKIEPNPDTYFNLAATKNKLDDFCGFCENMNKAAIYGEAGAAELYDQNCTIKDSIFYNNVKSRNKAYYCIINFHKCLKKKTYQFYLFDKKNEKTSAFKIIPTDSSKFNEQDFESPSFDIENIPKECINFILSEEPYFPGGDYALNQFLYDNLEYPSLAVKYHYEGKVYARFYVETDGSITHISIMKGIGGGCNEEFIRVIKLMPKWIPGKQNGKVVRMQHYLPIKFTLN